MKVLSLFDGMACGAIAFGYAAVEIESYDAYEIDKYAIQTATHNFPFIQEHGDVFSADFTQYEGVDFLIGGSPCTYWSIAQTKNRETVASGMGWELFSQYVRALHEAKPKYFIYENNKSMSKQIRTSIDEAFGFEAVLINSALVSAQNRQRLYWVGRRNADGTYSKVDVEQPEDRGILLKDVLDSAVANDLTCNNKSYALTASYGSHGAVAWNTIERHQRNMVTEPVNICGDGKARTLISGYDKQGLLNSIGASGFGCTGVAEPVGIRQVGRRVGEDGHRHDYDESLEHEQRFEVNENPQKSNCVSTVQKDSMVAEPVCMRYERSEEAKACRKAYEAHEVKHGYHELHELHPRTDGKTNTLSTVLKDNPICEPLQVGAMPRPNGELSTSQGFRIYSAEAKSVGLKGNAGGAGGKTGLYAIPTMPVKEATARGYTEIECGECVDLSMPNSKTRRGRSMVDKANCMQTSNDFYQYVGYVIEFDDNGKPIKAIGKDGKKITIYEVKDGKITIKGKQYPIKLKDGYYIIRKLTVSECKRLQTVPEWYEFTVSNSQAYKMLGNGWTCEVIAHIVRSCLLSVNTIGGN